MPAISANGRFLTLGAKLRDPMLLADDRDWKALFPQGDGPFDLPAEGRVGPTVRRIDADHEVPGLLGQGAAQRALRLDCRLAFLAGAEGESSGEAEACGREADRW